MKTLLFIIVIVIIALGAYFYLNQPVVQAPTQSTSSHAQSPASTSTAIPPNVGATEISNPNAPPGTPAECAKCDEYQGVQKAECLVALNCQ